MQNKKDGACLTMKFILCLCLIALPLSGNLNARTDDPLDQRQFNCSLSETRNGKVAKKVIADLVRFKNGRMCSDFIHEKFGFKWLRYRIDQDTTYIDETSTEVRLLKVRAHATDERNITVMLEFTVLEWDLDGTIKVTKNDRLRRYYDMAGREKGGKPAKPAHKVLQYLLK